MDTLADTLVDTLADTLAVIPFPTQVDTPADTPFPTQADTPADTRLRQLPQFLFTRAVSTIVRTHPTPRVRIVRALELRLARTRSVQASSRRKLLRGKLRVRATWRVLIVARRRIVRRILEN